MPRREAPLSGRTLPSGTSDPGSTMAAKSRLHLKATQEGWYDGLSTRSTGRYGHGSGHVWWRRPGAVRGRHLPACLAAVAGAKRRWCDATVAPMLSTLRGFTRWLYRTGNLDVDPPDGDLLRGPARRERRPKALVQEDLERIRVVAKEMPKRTAESRAPVLGHPRLENPAGPSWRANCPKSPPPARRQPSSSRSARGRSTSAEQASGSPVVQRCSYSPLGRSHG